jgi:GNAT superfamily N-acetyltransferase
VKFTIRTAIAEDAQAIGQLAKEFAEYLRSLGDVVDIQFGAEAYLRDGFGSSPAFSGLVAEHRGEIIGYLLYHPGYDVDYVTRTIHVVDLYVWEKWRRQGAGRALMEEAARICRRLGGAQLFRSVYAQNKEALAFYRSLGARSTRDLEFMRLDV